MPEPALVSLGDADQPSTLAYSTRFVKISVTIENASYLTVNELNIMRALRVTVARSIACTGLVRRVLRLAAIFVHGDKVDSAVKTTRKLRNVHVEGELLILQAEHLVIVLVLHQVHARTDVFLLRRGNKFESESVAAGRDTISAGVVCAVKSAIRSASGVVRAGRRVPRISRVAIGIVVSDVKPAPVGVKHNRT